LDDLDVRADVLAMIVTAYMVRSMQAANIPAGALWLT
jgi:hypothetical protein